MVTRTDSAHPGDLSYPVKPDSKGYARKYVDGHFYYFGPHNTWESFGLFGEWRKRLIETGEAPDVKKLKAELKKSEPRGAKNESRWRMAVGLGACVALCVLTSICTHVVATRTVTQRMLSTNTTPAADEFTTSLTDEEKAFVLGIRRYNGRKADVRTSRTIGSREAKAAARAAAIMEVVRNGTEANSEEGS